MIQKKLFVIVAFAILVFTASVGAAFSAPALNAQSQTVDSIIAKSGIREQAAMIPMLFADLNAKPEEETERSRQIDTIFQDGFAPDKILAEIKQTFLKHYDEKNAREVVKFYDSALGKKIAQSEIGATDPGFPAKMEGFDIENYDKKRRQVVNRLFDTMKTMEFQSELQSIVLEMVIRSANAVLPKELRMPDKDIIEMWKKLKDQAGSEDSGDSQRTTLLNMFYVTYEDITNAELEQYDKFLNSKPGKWLDQCSQTGFINALKKSATQVIIDLTDYMDKHPRSESEDTGEDIDIDDMGDI